MRNDRVLIPVLHVAHNTNCFSPHLIFSSKTIRQLYFITKMPTFGLYEYKVEGSAVCSIENGASLKLIHNLSKSLACFDRDESSHHNLLVIFHFYTRMTRKIDKNLVLRMP